MSHTGIPAVEASVRLQKWGEPNAPAQDFVASTLDELWSFLKEYEPKVRRVFFFDEGQRKELFKGKDEEFRFRAFSRESTVTLFTSRTSTSPSGSPTETISTQYLMEITAPNGTGYDKEIPWFFQDPTFRHAQGVVQRDVAGNERRCAVVTAVPGAGKTRTLLECIRAVAPESYHRQKLHDIHCLLMDLDSVSSKTYGDSHSVQYSTLMKSFLPVVRMFLTFCIGKALGLEEATSGEDVIRRAAKFTDAPLVVFLDEIQLCLSNKKVDTEDAIEKSDWRSCILPAIGNVMMALLEEVPRLSFFMSGTNCFAPLVLNMGSHLKYNFISLNGVFPFAVLEEKLREHFYLTCGSEKSEKNSVAQESLRVAAEFVRHNRRVTELFLRNLCLNLEANRGKLTDEKIAKRITMASEDAYSKWEGTFRMDVKGEVIAAIHSLLDYGGKDDPRATVVEAEGYTKLKLQREDFPEELLDYSLSGGLNVLCHTETSTEVVLPEGCMRKLLLSFATKITRSNYHLLHRCFEFSTNVRTGAKGHFFARAVAVEFTIAESQLLSHASPILPAESLMSSNLKMNPRCISSTVRHGTVLSSKKLEYQIWCENDDLSSVGKRWIDIAFPASQIVMIGEEREEKPVRVLCEVKAVKDLSQCWRDCFAFFKRFLEECCAPRNDSVALFISWEDFTQHTPMARPTAKADTVSACEARHRCLEAMAEHPSRLFILCLADRRTMLPLHQAMPALSSSFDEAATTEACPAAWSSVHL